MTGAEALAAFLAHLEHEQRASPRTGEAYGACVRAYLAFLERHLGGPVALPDLGAVTAADLRAYLAARRGGVRPLSARSASQALSAIRSFHRFLDARLGMANTSIALVRGPRVKPGAPRPISEDQADGLIAEVGLAEDTPAWVARRDQAVLTLLWGCGLRISEALSLKRRDAPLAEALRILGKGGKTRLSPVLPAVREAVDAYVAALPHALGADDPLFRAARGGPLRPRQVQDLMQRTARAPGPARPGDAARPAPFLRHPSAGRRRRSALDPGAARPRQPLHHPALYGCRRRRTDERLRQGPPEGVIPTLSHPPRARPV